jgi:hypothetical protein
VDGEHYLQIADATLSRWETGAQIQQRSMDRLLRGFFFVPEFRRFLGAPHPGSTASVEPFGIDGPLSREVTPLTHHRSLDLSAL